MSEGTDMTDSSTSENMNPLYLHETFQPNHTILQLYFHTLLTLQLQVPPLLFPQPLPQRCHHGLKQQHLGVRVQP